MVGRDTPASAILVELSDIGLRALVRDEIPEFWKDWDLAGVDAVSLTVGAFGETPFSYENSVRDLADLTHLFDVRSDRLITASCPRSPRRSRGRRCPWRARRARAPARG